MIRGPGHYLLLNRRRADDPSGAELMQVHAAVDRGGAGGNGGAPGTQVKAEGKDRSLRARECGNGGSSMWMSSFRRGCCRGGGCGRLAWLQQMAAPVHSCSSTSRAFPADAWLMMVPARLKGSWNDNSTLMRHEVLKARTSDPRNKLMVHGR